MNIFEYVLVGVVLRAVISLVAIMVFGVALSVVLVIVLAAVKLNRKQFMQFLGELLELARHWSRKVWNRAAQKAPLTWAAEVVERLKNCKR